MRAAQVAVVAVALSSAIILAPQALAQVDVNVGGDGSKGAVGIQINAPGSAGGSPGTTTQGPGTGGTAPANYTPPDFNSIYNALLAQYNGQIPADQQACFLTTGAGCAAPVVPGAPGAPPPPPSPAQVAQTAIAQLGLQAGAPQLSANPNAAVGLPVWMWVNRSPQTSGPQSVTATLGPTVVTATAVLSSVRWSMGPAGAVVVCNGPGTPAPARLLFQGDTSPDCGYSYALRSLPERTGGLGRWPVTATSTFTITWVGGGQTGAQTLTLSAATTVEVGELQAVVTGGN